MYYSKKILIIFLSFIISIFLCELILKLDDSYVLPETFDYNFNNRVYSFTNEISEDSNKENSKIYIMGDSFAAGFKYAAEKKDFPSILQNKYNNENIEVINMAIGGKSIPHYIEWITSIEISKNDKIILVLYENDILMDKQNCQLINSQSILYGTYKPSLCEEIISGNIKPKNEDSILKEINNKLRTVYLIKLLKNAIYQFEFMRGIFTREIYQKMWSDFTIEENLYVQTSLKFIQDFVKQNKASIYFTYFPNTHAIFDSKEKNKMTWKSFIGNMKSKDISIIDPFDFFYENASSSRMTHSLTDYHPNDEANKIMADFVYNFLSKH